MRLPTQAKPVMRKVNTAKIDSGVVSSTGKDPCREENKGCDANYGCYN